MNLNRFCTTSQLLTILFIATSAGCSSNATKVPTKEEAAATDPIPTPSKSNTEQPPPPPPLPK